MAGKLETEYWVVAWNLFHNLTFRMADMLEVIRKEPLAETPPVMIEYYPGLNGEL